MKKIVNHYDTALSCCQVLVPGVSFKGLENYRGRALCITSLEDTVQLPQTISSGWDWINKHYERIGLEHTKKVIWDSSFDMIGNFPNHELSVFMFTEEVHRMRADEKRFRAVLVANSKNDFINICKKLEVAIPKTICYETKEEIVVADLSFPLYLKADVSVSGLGVLRCKTREELLQNLEYVADGERFQIQEEINAECFVNVQYEVVGGVLKKFAITKQILDGNMHSGNIFPSGFDVWLYTESLAQFFAKLGISGYFAFDVAITENGPLVIECNPRFNGATYPAIVAKKLGIESWTAVNIKINTNSFEEFTLGELEYNPNTKKGIIVINWGCICDNKLGVLVSADNAKEQQNIIRSIDIF